MGTPDIQTPELMIDIKTVSVKPRIIKTPWSIVQEPIQVYCDPSVYKRLEQCQKTINFVKRLNKRYEKDHPLRYRNIITAYGLM